MLTILNDLTQFIVNSPTPYHAAAEIAIRLAQLDFSPLDLATVQNLESSNERFFVCHGGMVAAFIKPPKAIERILILAGHTDSPGLKLKPKPCITKEENDYLTLEVYGAPILPTWMSRDLYLAGRLVLQDAQGQLHSKRVLFDELQSMITPLAFHLNRDVNEKGPDFNKQDHLALFLGQHGNLRFKELIKASSDNCEVISEEFFAVPSEHPALLGAGKQYLASYRLDNLSSCHAILTAIGLSPKVSDNTLVISYFADHEEIGSRTKEGAGSTFLMNLIKDLLDVWPKTGSFSQIASRSLCVSADVAHGSYPLYPQKSEPSHPNVLGKGPTLKFSTEMKYSTSSESAAAVQRIAKSAKIPLQIQTPRQDMQSGSTIGPILASMLGMMSVDLGLPIWSMHSAREVIHTGDHLLLCDLLAEILKEKRSYVLTG